MVLILCQKTEKGPIATLRMAFKPVFSQTPDRCTIHLATERVIVSNAAHKVHVDTNLAYCYDGLAKGQYMASKESFKPDKVKEKSDNFVLSQGKLTS